MRVSSMFGSFLAVSTAIAATVPSKSESSVASFDYTLGPPEGYDEQISLRVINWPSLGSPAADSSGESVDSIPPRVTPGDSNAERLRRHLTLKKPVRPYDQNRVALVPRWSDSPTRNSNTASAGTYNFVNCVERVYTCIEPPCASGGLPNDYGQPGSQTDAQKQAGLDACATKCNGANANSKSYNNFLIGPYPNPGLACICGYTGSNVQVCSDTSYNYAHYSR